MRRNEHALDEIVGRLEKSWQGDARQAINRLYELLDKGMTTELAVRKLQKEFPALFTLTNLQDAMVEAAAYGYGIMPSILTNAEKATLARSLSAAWTSDNMRLSEKLHGLGVRMRDTIVQTINEQMDKNATWREASMALYDGYTGGGDVIKQQDLPKYLKEVVDAAKDAAGDEKEIAKEAERAARRVQELSKNGAPTKSLQAAYNQLVEAAESGSEEAMQKAVDVAMNEKSRYVADRIIRTETARAYNSGFMSKVMADDDVVALKWKLNTRHPVFDICDMFAKADMFGLGPGIFPKDNLPKTSIPVHPHCMCRFVEIYDGEVDMDKMVDRTQEAGEEWLKKLPPQYQRAVLGIEGQKQFLKDGSWQEYMRGWYGTGKPGFNKLDDALFMANEGGMNKWLPVDQKITKQQYAELKELAKENNIKLQNILGFNVNHDLVKETILQLGDLQKQYPLNYRGKKQITLMFKEMNDADFASTKNRAITLNSKAYGSKKQLIDNYNKGVKEKFFAQGTDYRHVVIHEYGHLLAQRYGINKRLQGKIASRILGVKKAQVSLVLIDELSVYGAQSTYNPEGMPKGSREHYEEIISEAFSSINGKKPTKFALQFWEKCNIIINKNIERGE